MRYLPAFKYLLLVAAVAVLILLLQPVAEAQCSMCRAVLSSSNNARFIRNFNVGVLVLLVPPVSIFCSIFIVLKRHRGRSPESGSLESGVKGRSLESGSLESWSQESGVKTSNHRDS